MFAKTAPGLVGLTLPSIWWSDNQSKTAGCNLGWLPSLCLPLPVMISSCHVPAERVPRAAPDPQVTAEQPVYGRGVRQYLQWAGQHVCGKGVRQYMMSAGQLTLHAAQAANGLLQAGQRFSDIQGMQINFERVDQLSIPAGQTQHMTLPKSSQQPVLRRSDPTAQEDWASRLSNGQAAAAHLQSRPRVLYT